MPTIYTKLCDSVTLVAASPRWDLRGELALILARVKDIPQSIAKQVKAQDDQ
jgi:hypothetical protein